MFTQQLTAQELTGRWEDLRDIKNLMGRMVNAIQLNRNLAAFEFYWSHRDDISLGLNNGFYRGQDAVSSFYHACFERNVLIAKLLQRYFPDKLVGTIDDIYGAGEMRALPLSTPLVEIAGDGKTAKGIWTCLGNCEEIRSCGPASYWVWAYYAADFIREDGNWKIWHMMFLEDVHHLAGQNWAQPEQPLADREEFSELSSFSMPPFTEQVCLRHRYDGSQPRALTPKIPVPYDTFSETFSYGELGGAYIE